MIFWFRSANRRLENAESAAGALKGCGFQPRRTSFLKRLTARLESRVLSKPERRRVLPQSAEGDLMTALKPMNRRTALATLGSAGLGLWAMQLPTTGASDNDLGSLLPKFSEKARKTLRRLLDEPGFSGHIPVSEVKSLADSEGKSVDALMLELLPLARTYSRPPISNYLVGAVVRGTSGNLYLGANIEFPGHSLGLSVHAEQAALSNAYMHSDGGILSIAVTAPPCGHCRQFMNELSPERDIQILLEGRSAVGLSSLLPMAFGPKNLGFKDGAFPVQEVELSLPKGVTDELIAAALEAARKSYSPYAKAPSGVAIGTRMSRIYKGSYIENAAFNPSLSPFQTALAALIVAGESYSAISRVVLAEVEGVAISQKSVAEAVLAGVAPAVKLQVVGAVRKA
jgi:cytidine deaminase